MTEPKPTATLYAISCWCRPKNVPEDADEWGTQSWMSPIIPSHTKDGKYVRAEPTIPCPRCGTLDRIAGISSPPEKWGL